MTADLLFTETFLSRPYYNTALFENTMDYNVDIVTTNISHYRMNKVACKVNIYMGQDTSNGANTMSNSYIAQTEGNMCYSKSLSDFII